MRGNTGPSAASGRLRLEEHLAVPYLLTAYSAVGDDGRWHRYLEYREIGITVEGDRVVDAFERLEAMRVEYIVGCFERGDEIPVPRAPLRSLEREIAGRTQVEEDTGMSGRQSW